MNSIRKILVPVDFSEPSRAALSYAAELARSFDATIDVLHVWEVPTFFPARGFVLEGVADQSLIDLAKSSSERALKEFVAEASKQGARIRDARSEVGTPSRTIVEFANAGGYDLIVIGTHGRTGLSHAVIGSVAERVVRHARCPVLSVRSAPAAPG
jgi:nucleotide-binding universal stress UspA family protein